jgi:hypothetical protein
MNIVFGQEDWIVPGILKVESFQISFIKICNSLFIYLFLKQTGEAGEPIA